MSRRASPKFCRSCGRLDWHEPTSGTHYIYPVNVWTWHGAKQVREQRGYLVRIKSISLHASFTLTEHGTIEACISAARAFIRQQLGVYT